MRRRAFTLIELMVVIAIIALLATILLPMANRAKTQARRTALAADIQVIINAIDAYQHDYGDIPRPDGKVGGPFQGSVILSWALLAPGPAVYTLPSAKGFQGDGADGMGFRVRGTTGMVHGPYLPESTFRCGLSDPNNPVSVLQSSKGIYDDSATMLSDREGNAILYLPRKQKVKITNVDNYLGALGNAPAFVANDDDPGLAVQGPGHKFTSIGGKSGSGNTWAIQQFQLQMPGVIPDASGKPTLPDANQATKLPYLLWDAGPDGRFCTDDDVTNFKN